MKRDRDLVTWLLLAGLAVLAAGAVFSAVCGVIWAQRYPAWATRTSASGVLAGVVLMTAALLAWAARRRLIPRGGRSAGAGRGVACRGAAVLGLAGVVASVVAGGRRGAGLADLVGRRAVGVVGRGAARPVVSRALAPGSAAA